MAQIVVNFTFHTGVKRKLFEKVLLRGSWNSSGEFSSDWTNVSMSPFTDETGCDAFRASVALDASQSGQTFNWGVQDDTAARDDTDSPAMSWLVVTEIGDANSSERYRSFVLDPGATQQEYWLAIGRRLGAQKWSTGVRFGVWAPNASKVEVVFAPFGDSATGYISDDGTGIDPTAPVVSLVKGSDNVWQSDANDLPHFDDFLNRLYMFRIIDDRGNAHYKVDIFSRSQAGRGDFNPGGKTFTGSYRDLDGIVSCSVISDPDQVTTDFNDTNIDKQSLIASDQFWADEYKGPKRPPTRLDELVIYELHVGSLGFPSTDAGTFADALTFVDTLSDLGVNAVELLPVLEFDGDKQWGYGTSLFYCLQTSAGGANQIKHFVKACHQRGIAVILDVVYNHFAGADNDRSEWGYDSNPDQDPQKNIWYWYEGLPSDYPGNPAGGYLNNGSSGYTPRFNEETVRQMFTSSAAALLDDFHIDGLRVDLTDAIHQDNSLNANGASVGRANQFGTKFLRELARTVKTVNPSMFLIAEDHTGWGAMTQPLDTGGVGFDAVWYSDFYHHLIGDGNYGDSYAKLLKNAGFGVGGPLKMEYFAGALLDSQNNKIVYHENHDEAGNESATERTIVTAVNGAALIGDTREYAEARCRFVFGMAALSAGTPMFLMGEEIGAAKNFRYDDFYLNKEDLLGQRTGDGQFLFRFYRELIHFVAGSTAARSLVLDVIHSHDANRVIAFTRTSPDQKLLVIGSLSDVGFASGYVIGTDESRLPSGGWREVFNSDGAAYRGHGVGNEGATLQVSNGDVNVVIPANGFVVLEKVS